MLSFKRQQNIKVKIGVFFLLECIYVLNNILDFLTLKLYYEKKAKCRNVRQLALTPDALCHSKSIGMRLNNITNFRAISSSH